MRSSVPAPTRHLRARPLLAAHDEPGRDCALRTAAAGCNRAVAWSPASRRTRTHRTLRPEGDADRVVRFHVRAADQIDAVGDRRKHTVQRFLDRLRLTG